jgi:hypothetical protein
MRELKMIATNIQLTEIQRQELLAVLMRRFQKVTDCALLELERLTRHPAELEGFQAKNSHSITVPQRADASKLEISKSSEVPESLFHQPISRREFLSCSLIGLMSLSICGTGSGWLYTHSTAKELKNLISDIDIDTVSLDENIRGIQAASNICNQVLSEYRGIYLQTIQNIAELEMSVIQIRSLCNQLDEMGMNIAEVVQQVLGGLSLIREVEKYAKPLDIMLEIAKNTQNTTSVAENTINNLKLWFSNDQDQGLNNRLFIPIQSLIQSLDEDIKSKVDSIRHKIEDIQT